MKKLLLLMCLALLTLPSFGTVYQIGSLSYDLHPATLTADVVKGATVSGDITIPETVERAGNIYTVTSIGDYAFQNFSGLTSITVPWYVESIGNSAFSGCSGLTSISLPRGLISIGGSAFKNCSKLTSITIPYYVESIGSDAFSGCSGLTKVEASSVYDWCLINFRSSTSNPLYYAHHLYVNGEEITNLKLTSSILYPLNSINKYAFYGCSGLTSVTIPNSVTEIGNSAFYGCSGLTKVEISDIAAWCNISFGNSDSNPLYYAGHLYKNGNEITDLIIPESITAINDRVFEGCSGLKSITFPNSVTTIGSYAFSGCSGLKKVFIPTSVKTIKSYAFQNTDVKFAFYPNGLTISNFSKAVRVSTSNIGNFVLVDNAVYSADMSTVYFVPCNFNGVATLPTSVTDIGNCAFALCDGIEPDLSIPENIKSIGDYAFAYCDKVEEIIVPAATTTIGANAFSDMTSLTDLYFQRGNDPISIGANALAGTSVKNLYLGRDIDIPLGLGSGLEYVSVLSNVTRIADNAFKDCTGLTRVTFANNGSLTAIGASAFEGCTALPQISVPQTVESLGASAFRGCSELQSAGLSNKMTAIGETTFYNCPKLSDLTLPEGIVSIGREAFYNCVALPTLNIPAGVTEIAPSTFRGCSALDNIMLPSGLTTVGTDAFRGCSTLSAIVLPNAVTSLGTNAFNGCSALASARLSEGLTAVPENVFDGCEALAEISFPEKIQTIGENAFRGCSSLASATMSDNVTTVGDYAFSGCVELKEVTLSAALTSIGKYGFYGDAALTELTLPRNVHNLGSNVFNGCTGLTKVYSLAEVPAVCEDVDCFSAETKANAQLYVPTDNVEDYMMSKCWKDFKNLEGLTEVKRIEVTGASARLRVGKTMNLTATVTPEDATFPAVSWSTSNADVATVSDAGVVTAVSTGYVVITARAKDAAVVEGTYELNIIEVLLGDANDNDAVTVTDAAAIASYVMGDEPETFNPEAADVNESGDVTLADASGVITIVLNELETTGAERLNAPALTAATWGDRLVADNFGMTDGAEVAVSLVAEREFVALQADIYAEGGLNIDNVTATAALAATHNVTTKRIGDNKVRVVVFSPALNVLPETPLFNVTVSGTPDATAGITIGNILATTPDLSECSLGFEGGSYQSDMSGVGMNETMAYTIVADGSSITVMNATGATINIFAVGGARVATTSNAADVETFVLNGGLYLVQIGNKVEKVIVK